MREIKFRAYCNQRRQMFNVMSMAYFTHKQKMYKLLCYEDEETNTAHPKELFDFELMQYTGLKDRDGVEIYEGDVVQVCLPDQSESIRYKVEFLNGEFVTTTPNRQYGIQQAWTKVMGNIHQNPELLEAE